MRRDLTLITEAARTYGIDRRHIWSLIAALKLTPHPAGIAGRSKGLDRPDMRRLDQAMSHRKPTRNPRAARSA